jgi:hypothetical protein
VAEPLPYDPEQRPEPAPKPPPISRADWLVGAEEGMSAETERVEKGTPLPLERPRLVRPAPVEGERPRPAGSHPTLGRAITPGASAAGGPPPVRPAAPAPAMPHWDTGQSSVPMLRRAHEDTFAPSSPIPELSRDFPMDDAEERARVSAQAAEQRARDEAIAARPHAVVRPEDFDLPAVRPSPWDELPRLLLTDRRVQACVLGLLVLIAGMTFWPREEKTISVAHLKQHAARYADTQVRVGGRVAEVFPVGGSWAYTLIQGRDTIVVFTRTREPRRDERVVVVGTLSNGFLDGVSRAAIFESTR